MPALLGNTIEGTTPDGAYTQLFKPDGSVVHVDRDGTINGRWTQKDDLACVTYPDEEPDCLRPELDGTQGSFVDSDGSRYPFTLVPGNPKSL